MPRIAILDDYQNVARTVADWCTLPADCDVHVFTAPFPNEAVAFEALAPFEIVIAMRERTPFPATLFARLPRLKLLVTTGMRNAVRPPASTQAARHHRHAQRRH